MSLFILVGHFPWGTIQGRSKKAEQEATSLVLLHPVEEVTEEALNGVEKETIALWAEVHRAVTSDNLSPSVRKRSVVEN